MMNSNNIIRLNLLDRHIPSLIGIIFIYLYINILIAS